jgi:hypothetical protein
METMRRFGAGLIALVCWAGIVIQFGDTYARTHGVGESLWILLRFFTIISNVALAIAMTLMAGGRRVSEFLQGGLTLAILLVGLVYATMLAGLHPLSGAALVADYLLHYVSPACMAAYWFLLTPHLKLRWSAPWLWALFPITYFAYVLARGAADGHYPYPFIDIGKIGTERALLNSIVIGALFVIAGYLLVWLDRRLSLGLPTRPAKNLSRGSD